MTFQYLQTDVDGVAGTETNYRLLRSYGPTVQSISFPNVGGCPGGGTTCVDTAANTIFQAGVVAFDGFWTAGAVTSPTAANVGISGRVLDSQGRGLFRARIELTDQNGNVTYALTNPFGYYRFVEVRAGQAFVMNVAHKRYQFGPRVVTTKDELTEVDFEPSGTW